MSRGTLGLSVGYYDGGKFDYYNSANGTETNVNAKKDMTVGLGYAWGGRSFSMGLSGKYISSELVEQSKASAFAGDLGFQLGFSKNLFLGGALQNIGTKMTYVREADSLPQVARLGLMWSVPLSKAHFNFLVDAPYYLNDSEVRPALGIEGIVGPLALRAGYKSHNELQGLSFGAGFMLGQMSLDYSYGLVKDLAAEHRMSLSLKFGSPKSKEQFSSKTAAPVVMTTKDLKEPQIQFRAYKSLGGQIGIVKPGDTLAKIALRYYGDTNAWKKIYSANQHILSNTKSLQVGQKVVLP